MPTTRIIALTVSLENQIDWQLMPGKVGCIVFKSPTGEMMNFAAEGGQAAGVSVEINRQGAILT